MLKQIWCLHLVLVSVLLLVLVALVSSKKHGNPANDLVDMVNKNRTSQKLSTLHNNPGLGCIALQYAEECLSNCTDTDMFICQPSEDDFTEVFAPNCGVELPTFTSITGRIIGCQSKNLKKLNLLEAFSQALIKDEKSLHVLKNKTHTEVGVGVAVNYKKRFIWCVLFGIGEMNSSFVLEDRGQGIMQKKGCFSGANMACNGATQMKSVGFGFVHGIFGFIVLYFIEYLSDIGFLMESM